jgi:hypothetical protein
VVKRAGAVAAIALVLLAVATGADAVPPQDISGDPPVRVVQAFVPECGFTVRWEMDLEFEGKNFFDSDGTLVRQQLHIREENTAANVDSGLVLREGPDRFTQTTYFNPDGTIEKIVANGQAVNVQGGDERLKDVGHVVLVPTGPGRFEIAAASARHPVREATTGPLVEALKAFCDVLS